MLLDDYLADITQLLISYDTVILHQELTIDKRVQQQAHLFGLINFINNNTLHFREFIDASDNRIDKLAYSYHFQDQEQQLIFRYDNAKHKPTLAFVEHKHCVEGIIYSPAPLLRDVIIEVLASCKP